MSIPVVDFAAYSLNETDVSDQHLHQLSQQLKAAFTQVGFVFLKNTGISQEEVDRVLDVSMKFFLQPEELKKPFSRESFASNRNHGWISVETERLNPHRPADLKEAFNISTLNSDIAWPSSGDLSGFQEIQTSFFQRCKELGQRVLRVMAHSLGLDPEVFMSAHRLVGVDSEKTKEAQLLCGEHSDYGSITLLFQNSEGLQVRSRTGDFICAPVIPGTVLINIADMMQRWTSDQFVSVLHKVLLPPAGYSSTRQSLAFFVQPDDEAVITCCDGSSKYPPVKSGDYVTKRFIAIYRER